MKSLQELYEDWRRTYIYAHVEAMRDNPVGFEPEPYYRAIDVVRFYDRCPERLFRQMRSSLMVLCTAEKLQNQTAEMRSSFSHCLNATAVKELLDEYSHQKSPSGNWRTLGWF